MRVLEWIIGRVRGTAQGRETSIGTVPAYRDLNWAGLAMSEAQFEAVSKIDKDEWRQELKLQNELIDRLDSRLPPQFHEIHQELETHFETKSSSLRGSSITSLML